MIDTGPLRSGSDPIWDCNEAAVGESANALLAGPDRERWLLAGIRLYTSRKSPNEEQTSLDLASQLSLSLA